MVPSSITGRSSGGESSGAGALQPQQLLEQLLDEGSYTRLEDLYHIDWVPKEVFLKFRQQVEGYRLAANLEYQVQLTNPSLRTFLAGGMSSPDILGYQASGCNVKLVFKPVGEKRRWKLIMEPQKGDLRFLSRKLAVGPLLNVQFGIGHDMRTHTTGWKWKISSSLGANGPSSVRSKTLLPIFPGFDIRVGWNAEYILPNIYGAMGTGEPALGLNLGQFYGSVERVEGIFTHMV
eukprot:TRINITY_DN3632_c1_g1_i1.p1 TRINITY_DN3632_c1_g1~~TRINITY_DN3632_c1_g1_i1.p1  ORF type:complete len:234 (-),score=26.45 TRINITY_DN3632_c1_g1_i1:126-827(-)